MSQTLTGIQRSARLSKCGSYRYTQTRTWDTRPRLLVCMFNRSTADHTVDDPTITLLRQIASHNGYGGIVVVNGIPLRSPTPAEAVDMINTRDQRQAWDERDALQVNLGEIQSQVEHAGAVLLARGALADRCALWFDNVLVEIEAALPEGGCVYAARWRSAPSQ